MNYNELEEIIKEYDKELNDNKQKEDAIRIASSKVKIDGENSNKLLLCIGSYKVEEYIEGSKETPTFDENPMAKYKGYIDVETRDMYKINMDEVEDFENSHNVIHRKAVMSNFDVHYQNYLDVKQRLFDEIISEYKKQNLIKSTNAEVKEQKLAEIQKNVVLKLINTSEK